MGSDTRRPPGAGGGEGAGMTRKVPPPAGGGSGAAAAPSTCSRRAGQRGSAASGTELALGVWRAKPGCKTAVMDGVAGRPEGAVPAAPVRWRHLAAVCGQRGQPRQGRERRGQELHLVVCPPHAEGAVMGQ
ncbi:uncharacterized protein LOC143692318 [Agelaius phoeniceus]|uniref:uncharacterized protein LOC143692318 n=1 Tax=Agelaius phoeniceus TaxID=39638 RepID=UPI00405520D5